MRVTVVVFPGTNCDHDTEYLFGKLRGATVSTVWHRESDLKKPDLVVLPGGFSYGDYLRTGALSKLSPIMKEVSEYVKKGGSVVGICNGFQILCECGLLPGVLLQNAHMRFNSQFVYMKVENNKTKITSHMKKGDVINCPVAHFEGNYFADADTVKRLEDSNQIVFRYCSPEGAVDPKNFNWNVNGSLNAIAGITNETGTVIGFMPHPERSAEAIVGAHAGSSGGAVFAS